MAPRPQRYGVITASPVRMLAFSSFGIGRLCDALPGVGERLRAAIARPPIGARRLQDLADPLPQGLRVEHRHRPVIGRHPAELAHQAQRP